MSHTDNTRPWDVQRTDSSTLRLRKYGFEWLIAGGTNHMGGQAKKERKKLNRDRRQRDRLVVTMARRSTNEHDLQDIDVPPVRADRRCVNWNTM